MSTLLTGHGPLLLVLLAYLVACGACGVSVRRSRREDARRAEAARMAGRDPTTRTPHYEAGAWY